MSALVPSPAQRLRPGRPLTLAGIADGAEGLVIADLARAVAAAPQPPAISATVICRDGSRMAMLARQPGLPSPQRGYARLFHQTVLQADEGCDFDFLQGTARIAEPEIH